MDPLAYNVPSAGSDEGGEEEDREFGDSDDSEEDEMWETLDDISSRLPPGFRIKQVEGNHRKECHVCCKKNWCLGEWFIYNHAQPRGTEKVCLDCADDWLVIREATLSGEGGFQIRLTREEWRRDADALRARLARDPHVSGSPVMIDMEPFYAEMKRYRERVLGEAAPREPIRVAAMPPAAFHQAGVVRREPRPNLETGHGGAQATSAVNQGPRPNLATAHGPARAIGLGNQELPPNSAPPHQQPSADLAPGHGEGHLPGGLEAAVRSIVGADWSFPRGPPCQPITNRGVRS